MKTTPQEVREVIYSGVWQGVGKMYNVKVENGYTTIIVRPGEDVRQRSIKTKEKFASQGYPCHATSLGRGDVEHEEL